MVWAQICKSDINGGNSLDRLIFRKGMSMNPVMQDLLERVADGLVWVNADGVVTFPTSMRKHLRASRKATPYRTAPWPVPWP